MALIPLDKLADAASLNGLNPTSPAMPANPNTGDSTPPLAPVGRSLDTQTSIGAKPATQLPAQSRNVSSAMIPGSKAYGLPSITMATLQELKAFHEIFSRNRENQARDMEELRSRGLISMAPQAFDVQIRHLRVITAFCTRLEERIADSEKAGQVNGIEVIDLTQEDEEEAEAPMHQKRRQQDDLLDHRQTKTLKQIRTAETPASPGHLSRPGAQSSASNSPHSDSGDEDVSRDSTPGTPKADALSDPPSSPESAPRAPSSPGSARRATSSQCLLAPANPRSPGCVAQPRSSSTSLAKLVLGRSRKLHSCQCCPESEPSASLIRYAIQ
ncbi:hypothetical protein PTTG_29740 [Puccinia triticina 1-1 BBBD Race 1]|uniref:Uncharacterized protein n=1 Tax=Puccinia triticina (isolate 1-1 / race 1 (BBBD)) TaxID=630390 RepID=A0A180G2C9_PUCT1|nr:hypothetical protein PTTG_29740 [Puccinia triticina 1-1 BBBD Race 1]